MQFDEHDLQLPLLRRIDLKVQDRTRMAEFYGRLLGLDVAAAHNDETLLGCAGSATQIRLVEAGLGSAGARPIELYHVAFVLGSRRALAERIELLNDLGWPLHGLVDHGVSEALYLNDPEGNGVELAVNRPLADWPRRGRGLAMYTESLSVGRFLTESQREEPVSASSPVIGHLHLSVDDLSTAEQFFTAQLGLRVTQSSYPGALFFARGAYHHHFAVNTWGRNRLAGNVRQTGLIGCELTGSPASYLDLQHGFNIAPSHTTPKENAA